MFQNKWLSFSKSFIIKRQLLKKLFTSQSNLFAKKLFFTLKHVIKLDFLYWSTEKRTNLEIFYCENEPSLENSHGIMHEVKITPLNNSFPTQKGCGKSAWNWWIIGEKWRNGISSVGPRVVFKVIRKTHRTFGLREASVSWHLEYVMLPYMRWIKHTARRVARCYCFSSVLPHIARAFLPTRLL